MLISSGRDSRLHLNASGGPSQLTPHITSAAALMLQGSLTPASHRQGPLLLAQNPSSHFPQSSHPGLLVKDRPVSATWSPALTSHPHALDVWVSLNHDRKHWRHRGGRRGGPLPRAARRSRILWLFCSPAREGSTDLLGEGHGTSRPGDRACAFLPLSPGLLSSPSHAESSPSDPSMGTPNSYRPQ